MVKVDRHKYVKVAYHGFKQLSSDERKTGVYAQGVRGLWGLVCV